MNRLPDPQTLHVSTQAEFGGVLSIDLSAIEANWHRLAAIGTPSECAAVVKADAYGCGIEHVVPVLTRAGCKTFFVATLAEARRVRALSNTVIIYVLNGVLPETGPVFAELGARPVINSVVEMSEWDAFRSISQWKGGAALHVDTGMNRLGVSMDEATALAARLETEYHGLTLVMSHLACAETPEHPANDRQIEAFRELRRLYRGVPSSLANSSGIFLGAAAHCDLIRPGAALYGVNPTPKRDNPMRPAIELKARVIQVRAVERGETVGYGATWTARRGSKIAIVAVGYGDGYLRAASGTDRVKGGEALVDGKRCPLAGRISMDLIAVDVTDVPAKAVQRGSFVTLIGDRIGIDDVATRARTIGYEVLTNLGRRYHRVYRTDDSQTG